MTCMNKLASIFLCGILYTFMISLSFNCPHTKVCNTGDVQLVSSGFSASRGTVQLCYNHTWGSVCDNGWDTNEATVVCHQLGYNGMFSFVVETAVKNNFGNFFRCFGCSC